MPPMAVTEERAFMPRTASDLYKEEAGPRTRCGEGGKKQGVVRAIVAPQEEHTGSYHISLGKQHAHARSGHRGMTC